MGSPRPFLLASLALVLAAVAPAAAQTGLPTTRPGGIADPTPETPGAPATVPGTPTTTPRLPGAPGVPAEMPVSPGSAPTTFMRVTTTTIPPSMLPSTTLPGMAPGTPTTTPIVPTTLPGMR